MVQGRELYAVDVAGVGLGSSVCRFCRFLVSALESSRFDWHLTLCPEAARGSKHIASIRLSVRFVVVFPRPGIRYVSGVPSFDDLGA